MKKITILLGLLLFLSADMAVFAANKAENNKVSVTFDKEKKKKKKSDCCKKDAAACCKKDADATNKVTTETPEKKACCKKDAPAHCEPGKDKK
ncbi:MAG: hypothetical protein IT240_09980 [Bacteroidia bacterium]|jgi:hypothetical protein|nr:hypothetical protein [Bacteroidia bacterium]MCC6769361.1 hypothetical protein [Bacteroidia bacterium]